MPLRLVSIPVVGLPHHGAAALYAAVRTARGLPLCPAALVAEPDNPVDPRAVSVHAWAPGEDLRTHPSRQIGYVPREVAAAVGRALAGGHPLGAALAAGNPDPAETRVWKLLLETPHPIQGLPDRSRRTRSFPLFQDGASLPGAIRPRAGGRGRALFETWI